MAIYFTKYYYYEELLMFKNENIIKWAILSILQFTFTEIVPIIFWFSKLFMQ